MNTDKQLRQHLIDLLRGGNAHIKFEDVVADFPTELCGEKPANLPHSAWMLLEHMRIAQWDILEFSRNRKHKSPDWPKGYWPATDVTRWTVGISEICCVRSATALLVTDSGVPTGKSTCTKISPRSTRGMNSNPTIPVGMRASEPTVETREIPATSSGWRSAQTSTRSK